MSEMQAQESAEKKAGGKKRHIWIPVLLLLLVLSGGAVLYGYLAQSYTNRFLPGTRINGLDCSELSVVEAALRLDGQMPSQTYQVYGRDAAGIPMVIGQVEGREIGLGYGDTSLRLKELLEAQNIYLWGLQKIRGNAIDLVCDSQLTYEPELLAQVILGWEAAQASMTTAPEDAYVIYNETSGQYEVVPEVVGNRMDREKLHEVLISGNVFSVTSRELHLEELGIYEEPELLSTDPVFAESLEKPNVWLSADLTYDWNGNGVEIGAAQVRDWIGFTKRGTAELDKSAIRDFVEEQAALYDTYATPRRFHSTTRGTITVSNFAYGWKTDVTETVDAIIEELNSGGTGDREPVWASTAAVKGNNDIGNTYIEVDLSAQHMYLYQNGVMTFDMDVVSGNIGLSYTTPQGIFAVNGKWRNARMVGDVIASYWMPFYKGYGIHDAYWRTLFGGSIYGQYGSHGCVNVSVPNAEKLFSMIEVGIPVILYYAEPLPAADPAASYVPDGITLFAPGEGPAATTETPAATAETPAETSED